MGRRKGTGGKRGEERIPIGRRRREKKGICRARAVPSKKNTRYRSRDSKARNSKKMHNRGLSHSVANPSRHPAIAQRTKLSASRGVSKRRQTLTRTKRIVLMQFKVSKRIETPHCCRTKRTKARGNQREESEANGSIKRCVHTILDNFLLNQSRIFQLVLVARLSLSPHTEIH